METDDECTILTTQDVLTFQSAIIIELLYVVYTALLILTFKMNCPYLHKTQSVMRHRCSGLKVIV